MLLKLWNSFLEECNHILRQEPSPSLGKKTGAEVTFILSVTLSISWPIIAFPYPCYWKYKTKGNFLFCIEVSSFSCWSSPQPPEFKDFGGGGGGINQLQEKKNVWDLKHTNLSFVLFSHKIKLGDWSLLPITRWEGDGPGVPSYPTYNSSWQCISPQDLYNFSQRFPVQEKVTVATELSDAKITEKVMLKRNSLLGTIWNLGKRLVFEIKEIWR